MDNEHNQTNEALQEYATPEEHRARNLALAGILMLRLPRSRFMDEETLAHPMGQTQLLGYQYHHYEGPQAAEETQQFHECPKCHITFTRPDNLRRHIRRLHEAVADTRFYK